MDTHNINMIWIGFLVIYSFALSFAVAHSFEETNLRTINEQNILINELETQNMIKENWNERLLNERDSLIINCLSK